MEKNTSGNSVSITTLYIFFKNTVYKHKYNPSTTYILGDGVALTGSNEMNGKTSNFSLQIQSQYNFYTSTSTL